LDGFLRGGANNTVQGLVQGQRGKGGGSLS
jgi:hypothetical protein